MSIIPIIFFALLFGFGFGGTMTQEATPELSAPSPSAAVVPGTPSSVTMPPEVVKSMFDNREPLQPCGTLQGNGRGEQAWTCLQTAADPNSQGAELVLVGMTDEGDAIRTYLRVSHGEMEVYTDNSQDKFRGDPSWTFKVCQIPDDVRSECTGS